MPCAPQNDLMLKTAVGGPRIRGLVAVSLVGGVVDVTTASVAVAAGVVVSDALIFNCCGGLLCRSVTALVRALRPETSGRAIAGPHWARWRAVWPRRLGQRNG